MLQKLNLTSQLVSFSLWSTIPHVAIPIKCSCDSLPLACAPRDKTVWPFMAFPTWRITPVFVPPVIIQAPVVWATCEISCDQAIYFSVEGMDILAFLSERISSLEL